MNKKWRGAVVGVGYLGRFHAQKYSALAKGRFADSLEFVGVCDSNFSRAKEVASELGVKAFESPQQLISQVDLVTIASITSTHFELSRFFLENGIHVNVEKPMTETAIQAKELNDLAARKNLRLAVGQSERFNPVVVKIKELMKQFAQPAKFVEIIRQAPFMGRAGDVSVLHDLSIHDFDLLNFIFQDNFALQLVQGGHVCHAWNDWAQMTLLTKSGLEARVVSSRIVGATQRSIRIHFDDFVIEGDFQTTEIKIIRPDQKGLPQIEVIQCGKADHLLLETEAFLSSVILKAAPVVTGVDGEKAVSLVQQAFEKLSAKGLMGRYQN